MRSVPGQLTEKTPTQECICQNIFVPAVFQTGKERKIIQMDQINLICVNRE